MNPFRALKRPAAFAEQALGLLLAGGIFWWWLGIAESSASRLLFSASALLALVAVLAVLIKRGRTRLADASEPGSGAQAITALLFLAMSIAAAYFLVWWVPAIEGLRGQIASVVLRFGAAFLLVVLFWSNLLAAMAPKNETIEG